MIEPPKPLAATATQGWDQRWQLTLIEPPLEAPEPLPDVTGQPPPRRNVVISRVPAAHKTAEDAAEDFLRQTAPAVPGLEVTDGPVGVTFNDAAAGTQVTVTFAARAEVRLFQTHLFRIDANILTQIVVAWDSERSGESDEMIDAALGFTP